MTRTTSVRSAFSRSEIVRRMMAKAALVVATLGAVGMATPGAEAQVVIEHVQELRGRHVRWDYAGTLYIDDSAHRISTRGCSIDQIAEAFICEGYDVRFVNGWLRVYKDCGGPDLSWCEGQYGLTIRSRRNYYSLALTPLDCGREYDRESRGHRSGGGFYGRFDVGDGSFEIGIGVGGGGDRRATNETRSYSQDNRAEAAKAFRSGAGEVGAQGSLREDMDDVNDRGNAGFKSTREQSGGRVSNRQDTSRERTGKGEVGKGESLPIIDRTYRGGEQDRVSRDESGKSQVGAGTKQPVVRIPEKIIVKEADTVKSRTAGEKGVTAKPLPVQQPIVTMPTLPVTKENDKSRNGQDDRLGSKSRKAK